MDQEIDAYTDISDQIRLGRLQTALAHHSAWSGAPVSFAPDHLPPRRYGALAFPDISGVAYSHDPFPWNEYIDPAQGAVRMVVGHRADWAQAHDDYDRLVSLSAPERRWENGFDEIARYSQRKITAIHPDSGQTKSVYAADVLPSLDREIQELLATAEHLYDTPHVPLFITFDGLLHKTDFLHAIRQLLQTAVTEFRSPLELDFQIHLGPGRQLHWNLRCCRLLPTPPAPTPGAVIWSAGGPVIGKSRQIDIGRVIYIQPDVFSRLSIQDRHEIARLMGRLNRIPCPAPVLMLGPGRWGTTTPSLGTPVVFAEISHAVVMVEIGIMHDNLTPDFSMATHFLNDLIARNMVYAAIEPGRSGNHFHPEPLLSLPNRLAELCPGFEHWSAAVHVAESGPHRLTFLADSIQQKTALTFHNKGL